MDDFSFFNGSKVLITGNTGFKGSWLSIWMKNLGADLVGVSLDIPTKPALYNTTNLNNDVKQYYCDITETGRLEQIMIEENPDFVFHLAAQSIVSKSFEDPVGTITTNTLGSIALLRSLEKVKKKCTVIMVTSDKCYENVEWEWGYRENDPLGGKDIYSASKGAAEILISAYTRSFLNEAENLFVSTARAGNVIGGGDWADDRLIVDTVKNWSMKREVTIRSPNSVRPWQHVLEPLSGYLTMAKTSYQTGSLHGEAFNFGPRSDIFHTVKDVVEIMHANWFGFEPKQKFWTISENSSLGEAGLLKLNCEKAYSKLHWKPVLDLETTLKLVVDWYKLFYDGYGNMRSVCLTQLKDYNSLREKQHD